jgi:hypothetical protein
MYLPEMVSYDIAVIAKLMLWDTMFDKSRHRPTKLMEKLSYENILTNITLHQIDSTSLHLLFQRNFTLLNVINYQDFLYGISLPDIHLDLVFINMS